jgi:hypothetical protein
MNQNKSNIISDNFSVSYEEFDSTTLMMNIYQTSQRKDYRTEEKE